jgi:hypothetical protein
MQKLSLYGSQCTVVQYTSLKFASVYIGTALSLEVEVPCGFFCFHYVSHAGADKS